MSEPLWLLPEVIIAVHSMLLDEHGGSGGIRDQKLLESALARPLQKYNYEPDSSLYSLAASYSYGLAKNHPFVDGNKRVALTAGLVFLEVNGFSSSAPEIEAAAIFEKLAAGKIKEKELAQWFELHAYET